MTLAEQNLLYVGDVFPEPTTGGEALLHRLLASLPAKNVRMAVSSLAPRRRNQANVFEDSRVLIFPGGVVGAFRRPFARVYATWLYIAAASRSSGVIRQLAGFRPNAVLTVAHGYAWLTAAHVAQTLRIPIHIIFHDDWRITRRPMVPLMNALADRQLRQVYRRAASRLCVSPRMAEIYERDFGPKGSVLYPFRAPDALAFREPAASVRACPQPFVLGYAGSLYPRGYAEGVAVAADALALVGGRVIVYSNVSDASRRDTGLDRPNIEIRPIRPSNEVIKALRDEATALLATMSFDPAIRAWMATSFPSKLTDYTATGLPIIAWGPTYSSVIQWARATGAAEPVDSPDVKSMSAAIARLSDTTRRAELSRRAIDVGDEQFNFQSARRVFFNALGWEAQLGHE